VFDSRLALLNGMNNMKTKLLAVLCAALVLGATKPCFASDDGALATVADVVVVRPGCLIATAVGSVFFVVSLPVAAISKSVKRTAHTLVVKPAQATFTRPVGDMDALMD
jgi:hypothetical protein